MALAIPLLVFAASQTASSMEVRPLPPSGTTPIAANNSSAVLRTLLSEAISSNPEIRAAAKEQEASVQRIPAAGAFDDPMLEAGVLNLPTQNWSFSREEMTMKMLGLSQRLPYPGKRDLKRQVAQGDAEALAQGYRETVSRVARELKTAYFDLALAEHSRQVIVQNRALLGQLLKLAEDRYAVAQSGQLEVLQAQTALSRMTEELIKLDRERPTLQAEIHRLLGRAPRAAVVTPDPLEFHPVALVPELLAKQAFERRPQLLALQALAARSERALELARKERYPDFDIRFSYGQRDRMPDGTPRSDMVSLTVAINLPIWREAKVEPRIAEAQAMYEQASSMYEAQRNETIAKLRQQIAIAEQSLRAASLYASEITPQAELSVEAAEAAYRVNRVPYYIVLDNRMTMFKAEIARLTAIASYNKALAEIDFLTGATVHSVLIQ